MDTKPARANRLFLYIPLAIGALLLIGYTALWFYGAGFMRDEIADFDNLAMWLEIDGQRYQDGSTKTMVFKVPHLVSYCSRFMSLQPGDVISTGTPPGVGMGQKPPKYLEGGEVMKLGIEGLGVQTQKVGRA